MCLMETSYTLLEEHAKLQKGNISLQFTHLVHNVSISSGIKFSTHDNTGYIPGNNTARISQSTTKKTQRSTIYLLL